MNVFSGEAEEPESSSSHHQGLPKSTVVVAGFAIAMAGVMTFLILKWSDSRTASTLLREQIAEVEVQIEALRPQLEVVEGDLGGLEERTQLLDRGKLAVCNYSGDTVTIKVVSTTWFGDDGEFKTFNSAEKGLDLWKIPAGERMVLTHPASGWDGSVTYYALWLRALGEEYPFAGPWPPGEDDCVLWR